MAQLLVRNLDESVVANLKRRAELHGKSLEQVVREVLTASAKHDRAELLAAIDRCRAMTPDVPQSDSTQLIREDRDNR